MTMAIVESARRMTNADNWPIEHLATVAHRARKGPPQIQAEIRITIVRGSPKRGNGLSLVNRWLRGGLSFLCRRTSKALKLDLGSRCHSLADSARHSSALFHVRGLE